MFYKKGAMFGLDARIALAIFGALSVISGAALYSAIQDSKVTALLTDMNEAGKAYEAYLLDTGNHIGNVGTANDTEKSTADMTELKTSSAAGWKGPYLNYELESYGTSGNVMLHPQYYRIQIITANDNTTWGDTNSWNLAGNGFCTVEPCFLWTLVSRVPEGVAIALDEKVDGVKDGTSGLLKWKKFSSGYDVYLKLMPTKSPL
tara:strand:- start:180 stop:791 length:612 start_codon:yes stop_codon:yes gene_type:complete